MTSGSCVDHIVNLPRDLGDGLGVDTTTNAVVCTAGVVGSPVGITGAGVVGVLWRAVVTGGIRVDAGGSEDEVGVGAKLAVCSSSKHCEYQSFKVLQTNPALQQVNPFHVFPPH